MNERILQALIRLLITFVVAGIGAIIPLLTILTTAVEPDQVPYVAIFVAGLTAVLQGVLKYLGGATQQAPESFGRGLDADTGKRPNVLAV